MSPNSNSAKKTLLKFTFYEGGYLLVSARGGIQEMMFSEKELRELRSWLNDHPKVGSL